MNTCLKHGATKISFQVKDCPLCSIIHNAMLLSDTDLWGLICAIRFCQREGYLEENQAWAEEMLGRLGRKRDQGKGGG